MDSELIEMFEAMLEQLQDYSDNEWVCGTSNSFTLEQLQEKLKELKSNE